MEKPERNFWPTRYLLGPPTQILFLFFLVLPLVVGACLQPVFWGASHSTVNTGDDGKGCGETPQPHK